MAGLVESRQTPKRMQTWDVQSVPSEMQSGLKRLAGKSSDGHSDQPRERPLIRYSTMLEA